MVIKKVITFSVLPLLLLSFSAYALDKEKAKEQGGKQIRWEVIQLLEEERLRQLQAAGQYTGNPLLFQYEKIDKIKPKIIDGNLRGGF